MPAAVLFIGLCICFILTMVSFIKAEEVGGPFASIGLIFLIIFLIGLWVFIKYVNADTIYVRRTEEVKCYWIDEQPYYKQGDKFHNLSALIHQNLPSDTKFVVLTYKAIDTNICHYGIYPSSDCEYLERFDIKR